MKNKNLNKSVKNDNREEVNNQENNAISNLNPFYENVPGGYRESYLIIRCQPHLSNAEKLVYDELIYYYRESGKKKREAAFPSQDTLALKIGRAKSSISRVLSQLEKHGLIEIANLQRLGNRNKYILLSFPLKIWDNYFRMLETEKKQAPNSTKKKRKQKQIDKALEIFRKQFQNSEVANMQFQSCKSETLSCKLATSKPNSTERKSAESVAKEGAGNSSINQSYLSEYSNQSIKSDKSDDSEESILISETEIDDKSSKRSDISNSNDQSSSHCDKEREQSRTDDDRTDKFKQADLNQNSSPAAAENEKFRETIDKFRETKDDWRTSTGHLVTLLKLIGIDDGFGFAGRLRKKFSDAVVIEGVKRFKQQQAVGNQKERDNPEGYLTTVLSNISPSKKSSKKEKKSTNDLPDNLSLWSWEQINAYSKKLERAGDEEYAEFWDRVKREKFSSEKN